MAKLRIKKLIWSNTSMDEHYFYVFDNLKSFNDLRHEALNLLKKDDEQGFFFYKGEVLSISKKIIAGLRFDRFLHIYARDLTDIPPDSVKTWYIILKDLKLIE